MCVCITWMQCLRKLEKRSDIPKLALQMVMSCHVSAETQTWVLWKSN